MTLLIYSLIAGAILTILWLTFRLSGMMRLTHFRINRMVLVSTVIISLLLPLIAFRHIEEQPQAATAGAVAFVEEYSTTPSADVSIVESTQDWSWLPKLYLIGLAACALWTLLGLASVGLAVMRGSKHDGIIIHNRNIAPFTWGKWIILSEKDAENQAVLLHEQAHRTANHWLDLLLCRIANCLLWYWPSAWLLTQDLQTVHEYEADSAVVNAGFQPTDYQLMLVEFASGKRHPNIVNPFNYYSLKKRIIMMKQQSSSVGSRMRLLVMLPSLAALVLLASAPALAEKVQSHLPKDETGKLSQVVIVNDSIDEQEMANPLITVDGKPTDVSIDQSVFQSGTAVQEVCKALNLKEEDVYAFQVIKDSSATARYGDAGKNGVINIVTKQEANPSDNEIYFDKSQKVEKRKRVTIESEEKVFTEVEVTPKFPGGDAELYKWLSQNIRYPENAAKNSVQGRVIVQFVVERDGSIGDTRIVRGVDPELDAEATRVIKSMPNFIPGTMDGEPVKVWYTLPLMFKLAQKENTASEDVSQELDASKVVAAQFPGGDEAMYAFVAKNIRYPEADALSEKSGVVNLNVCIDKTGVISDIKVADNSTGTEDMIEEAKRIVKLMPNFIPATYDGNPVGQWKTIPISFKIFR